MEKEVKMEKVNAERLPNGLWRIVIDLGDIRKTTSKLWVKKIKKIDTAKENGYAFEGEFAPTWVEKGKWKVAELLLKPGETAVALKQSGSWNHPGQDMFMYVAKEDGVYRVLLGPWETKGDKVKVIHKAAEILEMLEKEKEATTQTTQS